MSVIRVNGKQGLDLTFAHIETYWVREYVDQAVEKLSIFYQNGLQ